MNKVYNRRLLLEKWPLSNEHILLGVTNDIERKIDIVKYPGLVFYFKKCFETNKLLFIYNEAIGDINCNYIFYWLILEREYGINGIKHKQINKVFTKDMLKKHLKLNKLITMSGWEHIGFQYMEDHFMIKRRFS